MKRIIYCIPAIMAAASAASAQTAPTPAALTRQADLMEVNVTIPLSGYNPKTDRAVTVTPVIVNGPDSLCLKSVVVYGSQRYIQCQRAGRMLTGSDEISFRKGEAPAEFNFSEVVRYRPWMDGASLILDYTEHGCCGKTAPLGSDSLYTYVEPVPPERFVPQIVFVVPEAEKVKIRAKGGRAYIDFPVNKTEIYPDYRSNAVELAKIRASIDSISSDPDLKLLSLSIAGTASPEGPYTNNVRLAKGRTEALKDYVDGLYGFAPGFITTSYVPEDWDGLREYLTESAMPDAKAILAVVDSDLEPDAKDAKIRKDFPEAYRFLLQNVYPALRHSDYITRYEVATYSDAASIAEVFAREPGNLSLNELYILAQSYPQGSDEFSEVFETAVRLFPDDETSNLNAAGNALVLGQLSKAEKYLDKAGASAQAEYARGVLAFMREDYPKALQHLSSASTLEQAQALADYINSIISK